MTSEFGVAVHALVYLHHKGITLSSEELSKNICTNPARVRKVMSKLKKAGIISTKEGAVGGYTFIRKAEEVTLQEISSALDVRFVSSAWRSGDTDMVCLIASGMADVMDGVYQGMDDQCKGYLEGITIQDIDDRIFGEKRHEKSG